MDQRSTQTLPNLILPSLLESTPLNCSESMKIIRQSFLIKPNFKIRNHYFPTTGLYLKSKTENLNEKRQKTLIKIRPINLRKVKVPPISDSLKQEIKGSLIKWKPGTKLDSQVFRALDCNTGKIFAVKMASFDKRKIDLLLRLKHKNIVEYYGYDILSSDKCHLYMEYIAGGNLQDIVKRFGSLSEEIIKSYAIQLIQGLQYLQKNGFFISQIKSKKILIANDGTLNLLPEFGDNKSNENENQSLIISFGHILLEMLTGKLIDTNAKYDIDKIKSGKELKKLIKNCFTSEIHCEKNLDYLMEFAFLTE